jgi:hypothetical protein
VNKLLAGIVEVAESVQKPALSGEELAVAKSNLRFALDNCPVDGGLPLEDGCVSSREATEALLGRLEAMGTQGMKPADLAYEEVGLLRAIADYALDGCPIEGGMTLDDGSLVSRGELRALRDKILSFPRVAQE